MNKIIPSIKVPIIQKGVVSKTNLSDELKRKKIIMFGVPGAFTPTCSEKHMPSYIKLHKEFIKYMGYDNPHERTVMQVGTGIYDKMKDYLITTYKTNTANAAVNRIVKTSSTLPI